MATLKGTANTDQFLAELRSKIGSLYVYGAEGPNTFDCSGVIQWALKNLGVDIGRVTDDQYAQTKGIARADLKPGDLIFFKGQDGVHGHVAVYSGDGMIIEAPRTWLSPGVRGKVREVPLASKGTPTGYRRIKELDAGTGKATDGSILDGITDAIPGLGGGLDAITAPFTSISDDFATIGKVFSLLMMPTTWVRFGSGALGVLFIIAGIYFLVPRNN